MYKFVLIRFLNRYVYIRKLKLNQGVIVKVRYDRSMNCGMNNKDRKELGKMLII